MRGASTVRFFSALCLAVLLLIGGCAGSSRESSDATRQPADVGTVAASDSSRDATETLEGWFVQNESAHMSQPGADDPDDAVGYFTVLMTGDHANGDLGTQRIYVTAATAVHLESDLLDPKADVGRWLWVDFHRDGEALVADRVYAPVGIAY